MEFTDRRCHVFTQVSCLTPNIFFDVAIRRHGLFALPLWSRDPLLEINTYTQLKFLISLQRRFTPSAIVGSGRRRNPRTWHVRKRSQCQLHVVDHVGRANRKLSSIGLTRGLDSIANLHVAMRSASSGRRSGQAPFYKPTRAFPTTWTVVRILPGTI